MFQRVQKSINENKWYLVGFILDEFSGWSKNFQQGTKRKSITAFVVWWGLVVLQYSFSEFYSLLWSPYSQCAVQINHFATVSIVINYFFFVVVVFKFRKLVVHNILLIPPNARNFLLFEAIIRSCSPHWWLFSINPGFRSSSQ